MLILTITDLLYKDLLWNKEKVMIRINEKDSKIVRLEFQYDAIDDDYKIDWMEPMYCEETKTPYLKIHCYMNDENENESK